MGSSPRKKIEKRAFGRAFLFAMAIGVSLLASNPSAAGNTEPDAAQTAAYEKATEGVRVRLLIALAKQGQHELADTLLQRYPLTGEYAKDRELYIEGLILRGRKDNKGAVAKFRAALADDPKLTLVRSDLAQTLVEMGEDDSAKHHLQLLEAEAPNEQVASNIRAFIDRIDANRPYRFSAYMSLAPSTNVNNGSSHSTTKVYNIFADEMLDGDISKQNRKKSGLGSEVGFNAAYSKRLGEHLMAIVAGGANARLYTDKDFDSFALSQFAELRYYDDRSSIGLGVVASQDLKQDWSGMSYYSFGPRIGTSVRITQRDTLAETVRYEERKYPDAKPINGWAVFTDLSWTHAFDSSFNSTASVGYNRIKSKFDPYSYRTWYAGMGFYKELPHGITVNLDTQAQRSEFDAYNVLGQAFRKDTRLIGSLGLVKRDWNIYGFAPSVEFTLVKNFSNLKVYDYDSESVDFRLTKDF